MQELKTIEQLRTILRFEKYESFEPQEFEIGEEVMAKTHVNKSGSAFAQMKEVGLVAGFTSDNRALILFVEREDEDGNLDYGLIPVNHLLHSKKGK